MLTQNGGDSRQDNQKNLIQSQEEFNRIFCSLTSAQAEFLDFVLFQDTEQLSKSLQLIHDMALYHTDIIIHDDEKTALSI